MWITDLNLAQKNDAGEVALCYYQTTNPLVEVNGRGYKFITRANICLAWVKPEDAPKILEMRGGCCGGKRPVFRVASEDDVRRWTNGGGR